MKFTEMKDLTVEELRKRHKQMREEMFETRMKHSLGQVEDVIVIRRLRRDMARVLTALNMKLGH